MGEKCNKMRDKSTHIRVKATSTSALFPSIPYLLLCPVAWQLIETTEIFTSTSPGCLREGVAPNEGWTCGVRLASKLMKQLLAVGQLKCSFVTPHLWKQLKSLVRTTPSLKQSDVDWIFCRVYFSRSQTLREWDGIISKKATLGITW